MTLDELINLKKRIEEELSTIPNFYTRYIDKCKLVRENEKIFEIFAFATHKTFTQHRMREYTSHDFNSLAMYYYLFQESNKMKLKLEKLTRINENFRDSLKKCNEIYNFSKQKTEEMKAKLKLSELPILMNNND